MVGIEKIWQVWNNQQDIAQPETITSQYITVLCVTVKLLLNLDTEWPSSGMIKPEVTMRSN